MMITLYDIAHARTGDKGNRANISLIAYAPEDYEILVKEATEERVAQHFSDRKPTKVTRYLLPNLGAMNFILDDVLDGGVNDSLNLDMQANSHGGTLPAWVSYRYGSENYGATNR